MKGVINGRYKIKSPLGAGGMGTVHLAEDRGRDNALVALKLVTPEIGSGEAASAAAEALTREFETLVRLRHPHLPAVYDFGRIEGESGYFISMEYIKGLDLIAASETLDPERALTLVAQICRALEFIHTRGLVHRDIKPENILVTDAAGPEPRAVIVDFGLASAARVESATAGTLQYVSPEALKGLPLDRRCDLYALGVILYRLGMGRCPFEGTGKEIMLGHLEREPAPPLQDDSVAGSTPLRAIMSEGLWAVILKLLAKDPTLRFGSAAETLQALNRATGSRHPIETAETGVAYATWAPLVGRDAEIARMAALIERLKHRLEKPTRERDGILAIVTGEAGVGKTRFMSEAKRLAQVQGILSAGVTCRADMPAFEPIMEAISLIGARTVELMDTADAEIPAERSRLRTVDAALSSLEERTSSFPTVLFIDDAHLGDVGTLAVCEALVRNAADCPGLLLVISCRTEEMDEGPLSATLARLKKQARIEEISLRPLDAAQTGDLLTQMLGLASAPEPLVSLVHRETSGNPFFVEEAVRSLMEDGTISRLGLSFRADVDALTAIPFPAGVGDAIRRRLARLDSDERRVVESLSVIGRPADGALIQVASGLSGTALDEALSTLETRQVVHARREGPPTTWVIASARVREYLYDGIDWDRKREIHTAIGAALKSRADSGGPVRLEELARHFINGGDASVGLSYALDAARHSRGVGAGADAADFYRRALELLPSAAHAERAEIFRHLGIIERELGREAVAMESFDQSMRAAMQASRRDLGAMARLEKASSLMARARPEEAVREVEKALELQAADGDLTLLARGQSILSGVLARSGKMERALEIQGRALDTARRGGSPRGIAASLNNLANLNFLSGRHAEAIGYLERSLAIRREIGDRHGELEASSNLGLFLVEAGRLNEAVPVLDGCVAIARSIGDLPALVESRINLGGAHAAGGRYDQAIRSFEEAAAVAIRIGDDARASNALDGWGAALRIIGDFDAATERHTQALERARRADDPVQETYALASLALDRALTGDPDATREAVRRAARSASGEISPRARSRILEATAFGHLAAGAPKDAEGAASEIIETAREGSLKEEEAQAHHLLGLARGAMGANDAASVAFDQVVALSSGGRFEEVRWRALAALAVLKGTDAARSRAARGEAAAIVMDLASRIADAEIRGRYLSRPDRAALLAAAGEIGPERAGARGVARGALSAIYRISELVTSVPDLDELLAHVLDLALEIVHAERGLIILVDGDRQEVRAARGVEPETVADALEYSRSVVRETAQGRTLITIDAEADSRTHRYKSVSLFRIKSLVCVPMKVGGRVIGTVYLDSRSPGTIFHDEEIEFLKAFANLAAAAMEMGRLNSQLSSENVSLHREMQDLRKAAGRRTGYQNIIGKTVRMQAVYDLLEKVSASALPVLITGESGTGKELVARAIHFTGPRKERKFLSENVAAIPGTLLESELFGHVRGAFTGADRDRKGVFELADGGTLFLDEIGDMSLPLQSKLLRVLQEGEIRPVGGKESVKVDVRIISATNRDLEGMMRDGRFREDLYYRLNVVRINIPPLRERKEDVPVLVEHFLDRAAEANSGQRKRMDISALQLLLRYDWPGNVRELENEIMKLSVLTEGAVITQQDLAQHRDLFDRLTRMEGSTSEFQSLIEMEKKQIERALAEAGGNRARAAALLGISRATIYRKLREHDLSG